MSHYSIIHLQRDMSSEQESINKKLNDVCNEVKKILMGLKNKKPFCHQTLVSAINTFDFTLLKSPTQATRKLALIYSTYLLYLLITNPPLGDDGPILEVNGPFIVKGDFIHLSFNKRIPVEVEEKFKRMYNFKAEQLLFNYSVQSTRENGEEIIFGVPVDKVLANLNSVRFLDCLPDPQASKVFIFLQIPSRYRINFLKTIHRSYNDFIENYPFQEDSCEDSDFQRIASLLDFNNTERSVFEDKKKAKDRLVKLIEPVLNEQNKIHEDSQKIVSSEAKLLSTKMISTIKVHRRRESHVQSLNSDHNDTVVDGNKLSPSYKPIDSSKNAHRNRFFSKNQTCEKDKNQSSKSIRVRFKKDLPEASEITDKKRSSSHYKNILHDQSFISPSKPNKPDFVIRRSAEKDNASSPTSQKKGILPLLNQDIASVLGNLSVFSSSPKSNKMRNIDTSSKSRESRNLRINPRISIGSPSNDSSPIISKTVRRSGFFILVKNRIAVQN